MTLLYTTSCPGHRITYMEKTRRGLSTYDLGSYFRMPVVYMFIIKIAQRSKKTFKFRDDIAPLETPPSIFGQYNSIKVKRPLALLPYGSSAIETKYHTWW